MALRLFALAIAATALAGCGGEGDEPGQRASLPTATEAYVGPPPGSAPGTTAQTPPSAWVETAAGPRWLGFSTFCRTTGQSSTCADDAAPRCGIEGVPTIPVGAGETLRFHLGFDPSELSLRLFHEDGGEPEGVRL